MKPSDIQHGTHAPVLYMLVFDARKILTEPGISFSDMNMQSPQAKYGSDEKFFSAIPFADVYHEGSHPSGSAITKHRCAEVLAPSPMKIDDKLQWIYCRSDAERRLLVHMLGPSSAQWLKRIRVSDDLLVFQKRYPFVKAVSLARNGIVFELAPRNDGQSISVKVEVWDNKKAAVCSFIYKKLAATPPPPAPAWRAQHDLKDGKYLVRLTVEDHLAFEANLVLGNAPF